MAQRGHSDGNHLRQYTCQHPAERLKLLGEQFIELFSAPNLRIERIVSIGHSSPPGYFYDLDWAEWVLVLQGAAKVLFEAEVEPRLLRPGDYLHIAAHARHRVE